MVKNSSKNILFISDTSLTNPILHSQGLPLLKSLSDVGFSCHIITFEDSKKENQNPIKNEDILQKHSKYLKIYQLKIHSSKLIPGWACIYFKGILKGLYSIIKYKIKVIHCRSFIPTFIGITLKAIMFNRKVLYDNRGVFIEEEIYKNNWNDGEIKTRVARIIERKLIKNSDRIVVVSNKFKSYLVDKYRNSNFGLVQKIEVISNKTRIHDLVQKIEGSNRDNFVGIYSGSTDKWQQVPELLKLFSIGIDQIENLRFRILTYDDIELLKNELNKFPRLIQHVEIKKLKSQMVRQNLVDGNFGILLREKHILNRVASPIKFAEYLASGLPVMISEGVGDTEDIINNYRVGVVIKNGDYLNALKDMLALLDFTDIRNRCIECAKKEFNIVDAIQQYKTIYDCFLITY